MHKGMRPREYGSDSADGDNLGWAYPHLYGSYNYQHFRSPYGIVQDTNVDGTKVGLGGYQYHPSYSAMHHIMASPHPGAMPSLFADGSTRGVSYTIDNQICSWLWFYNDGAIIPSSDLGQ